MDSYITVFGRKISKHATDLHLNSNQLSGKIPSALKSLTNLRELDLNNNQLAGNIPSDIKSFTNLQRLDLTNNQLSGNIPSDIKSLTNLQILYLTNNRLSGNIPYDLKLLTKLKILHLFNNQISGIIPSDLKSLTNLRELILAFNLLSGNIPSDLKSLTNLLKLHLNSNQLSGNIPSALKSLTNLRELYLNNNQLSGKIPSDLISLTNLRELRLNSNQLSGIIPSALNVLTNLQILHLNSNQLSGKIPSALKSLTNLRELSLYGNQLSGKIPSYLESLTNLQILNLSYNQLSGKIPSDLKSLTNLRELHLSYNELSGNILSDLKSLKNLQILHLNSNQLSGIIPSALESLTNLQRLKLQNNQIIGPVPEEIISIPKIYIEFEPQNVVNMALLSENIKNCCEQPIVRRSYEKELQKFDCKYLKEQLKETEDLEKQIKEEFKLIDNTPIYFTEKPEEEIIDIMTKRVATLVNCFNEKYEDIRLDMERLSSNLTNKMTKLREKYTSAINALKAEIKVEIAVEFPKEISNTSGIIEKSEKIEKLQKEWHGELRKLLYPEEYIRTIEKDFRIIEFSNYMKKYLEEHIITYHALAHDLVIPISTIQWNLIRVGKLFGLQLKTNFRSQVETVHTISAAGFFSILKNKLQNIRENDSTKIEVIKENAKKILFHCGSELEANVEFIQMFTKKMVSHYEHIIASLSLESCQLLSQILVEQRIPLFIIFSEKNIDNLAVPIITDKLFEQYSCLYDVLYKFRLTTNDGVQVDISDFIKFPQKDTLSPLLSLIPLERRDKILQGEFYPIIQVSHQYFGKLLTEIDLLCDYEFFEGKLKTEY